MKKVALVTGATGFVGYHICQALNEKNYNVIAVGSKGENTPECSLYIKSSLLDFQLNELGNIDVCYHQAANNDTTNQDEESMRLSNVSIPTIFFKNLSKINKCKNFVYASSCSVYGNSPAPYNELLTDKNPLNAYARSKLEFENQMNSFAKESQAKVIGLRYTNVYGPGELHKGKRASMITQIIQKIKLGENPKLFKSGEQTRDWVFVKDVVNANLQAADADISGIFNIGSGESMSFNRILDLINQELKSNYFAEYIECPYSDFYQTKTLANISQAEKKLGYKPEKDMEISVKSYIREIFLEKLEKCT